MHATVLETNKNAVTEVEEASSPDDESNAPVDRTYNKFINGGGAEFEISRSDETKLANFD